MGQLINEPLLQLMAEWQIQSVIVLQGEEWVEEWHESGTDTMGPLYSCTKSVLSALIGIMLERGEIDSIERPICDYLDCAEWKDSFGDRITIKHLLTMTPGFHWPDFDKPYTALRAATDPVSFALAQPFIHEPGHAFTYNSGGSHLLSAIVSTATGMSALQYAKEHLFQPLDFQAARWSERAGISEGGTGLSLFGRDLAKFGALYMQRGQWMGQRLLSPEWVESSTALHHRGLLHYEPPIYGGYGYHWWISPKEHNGHADCYFAFGHGGQYMMNIPELELTIVIRKKITRRNDAIWSRKLIFEHLVPNAIQLVINKSDDSFNRTLL